ncbi:MAG TPA: Asp23/Gls24 family envelope stress response protein [Syntrophomonadaceae bacterium]|nr:Asp23/Gls24 family envelope stress response protein [Syntrophomonadaceae bacterium]HQE23768.1 Asp23/Gls24 family envelope stress response protein [Syntrophomonadaceae bacterium]
MVEQKPELATEMGTIRIADEVVSTVAGLAAMDVEGVAAMSGGWGTDLVEKLGRKNFGKGIKVEVNNDETRIDIYIAVQFGYPIPEVAENVQKEVKVAVETMTGLQVTAVNVHVVSVQIKKQTDAEPELAADLDSAE